MRSFLIRVCYILLIVRTTASPAALRPATAHHAHRYVVVLRICAWPAQTPRPAAVRPATVRRPLGWDAAAAGHVANSPLFATVPPTSPPCRLASAFERFQRRALAHPRC